MSLITIEQLLESVDLDFEPRWVTKASDGNITLYKCKPVRAKIMWWEAGEQEHYNGLKLSEFEGKDWTECIYEVPRKTTGKIEQLNPLKFANECTATQIGQLLGMVMLLVDAVNELKGAKNE